VDPKERHFEPHCGTEGVQAGQVRIAGAEQEGLQQGGERGGRCRNCSNRSLQEPFEDSKEPPWKVPERSSDTGVVLASTLQKRLPTSHSSPASGFNDLPTTRLPRAQNPTITLLQKARGMCVRVYLRGCGCKSFMAHEGTKNMHLKCDVHFGKAPPFTFLIKKNKLAGGKYPRNCFCG
jgi:hypothetical protein